MIFCKPNCKPTLRHGSTLAVTGRDVLSQNAEPKRTVSYNPILGSTGILELESRCAVIRTVGSHPTSPPRLNTFILLLYLSFRLCEFTQVFRGFVV